MTTTQNLADKISTRLQVGANISMLTEYGVGQMAAIQLGLTQAGLTSFVISSSTVANFQLAYMSTAGMVNLLGLPDEVLDVDVFILDDILDEKAGVKILDELRGGNILGMRLEKNPLLIVRDSFTPEGILPLS